MWPWGHLAVGYLAYALYCRLGARSPPAGPPALVAALATQVPDLVDKPLAWSLSVLPSGRSLGHSLAVAALVLPVARLAADRRDARPLAAAFAVGYLSHLAADALSPLLAWDLAGLTFLAWPLLELPAYEVEQSFAAHLALAEPSPAFLAELGLVALAGAAWRADGYLGLAAALSWPRRLLGAGRSDS